MGPDDSDEEHVRVVHSTLRIPTEFIKRLLNISTRVAEFLEATPDTQFTASLTKEEITAERAEILRTFPEIVWLEIQRDAAKSRAGTKLLYPST